MRSTSRLGVPAFLLSLAGAFAWACSSSTDDADFDDTDGGADASSSGGEGVGAGGAQAQGGESSGGASTAGGRVSAGGVGGSTGGSPPNAGGATTGGAGPVTCSSDADCAAPSGRCNPATQTCVACLFDNECSGGERCIDQACAPIPTCTNPRECRANGDGRNICDTVGGLCVECTQDVDCGDRRVCAGSVCVDASACQTDDDCLAPDGAPAPSGAHCSPVSGRCVQCTEGADCGPDGLCVGELCRTSCASDNDCLAGDQLCNLTSGACVDCRNDGECDALAFCEGGTCKPDVCAQGVKSCLRNAVIECTENGSGVRTPAPCGDDALCVKEGANATCEPLPAPDGGTTPSACTDQQQNGDETDIDCGGGTCDPCGEGDSCVEATDCASSVCTASCTGLICFPGTRDKLCRPGSCTDAARNGSETDVDCGGDSCSRCAVGATCSVGADCESNLCQGNVCVAAACSASACPACGLVQSACCKSSGLCGCAVTFPFPGACL